MTLRPRRGSDLPTCSTAEDHGRTVLCESPLVASMDWEADALDSDGPTIDEKLNLIEVRELLKLPSAARAKVLKVLSTAQLRAAMCSSTSAPFRNYIHKLLEERELSNTHAWI